MPSSRHHNEWLSLIEVSGPFLSVPVLERVLPQGLDAHDPEHTRLVKMAFEEWEDDQQGERPNPAIHREWISFVLRQTLGLPDEVIVEGQEVPQTLRATIEWSYQLLDPADRRLLELLVHDADLRDKVDSWIIRGAKHLASEYGVEITAIITETIERWDAEEASRRIELHVGRDLQFIRINGTVVGALAGVTIYTVAQLLF